MEAELVMEAFRETLSLTFVLLGSTFLEIQPGPVNLMESGQELNQSVNVRSVPF